MSNAASAIAAKCVGQKIDAALSAPRRYTKNAYKATLFETLMCCAVLEALLLEELKLKATLPSIASAKSYAFKTLR